MQPQPPPVVTWYRAFCKVNLALYIVLIVLCIWMALGPDGLANEQVDATSIRNAGILGIAAFSIFSFGIIGVLRLPVKEWAYWAHTSNLIMYSIAICPAFISLPLLFMWLKPEVKAYYGVDPNARRGR